MLTNPLVIAPRIAVAALAFAALPHIANAQATQSPDELVEESNVHYNRGLALTWRLKPNQAAQSFDNAISLCQQALISQPEHKDALECVRRSTEKRAYAFKHAKNPPRPGKRR